MINKVIENYSGHFKSISLFEAVVKMEGTKKNFKEVQKLET